MITPAGVASGLAPGNVRIDARSGDVTGSASLAVSNQLPAVTTGQASVVRITAFIDGVVNPNGNPTQAYFEWGTAPTLAGANTTPSRSIGNANVPIPVSETLSNLGASTTYYYRVVASNTGGISRGLIQSFRTVDPGPPIVETLGGSNAGFPIAQLDGTVIPMGATTTYYFQYGSSPDSMYYQTSPQTAGSGFDPVRVVDRIQWGSALYVQLIAVNQYGVTYGAVVRAVFPSPVVPVVQRKSGTPAKVKGNQRE
jgi:hypothetical protein